jgi:SAM-dependent methyltransferase
MSIETQSTLLLRRRLRPMDRLRQVQAHLPRCVRSLLNGIAMIVVRCRYQITKRPLRLNLGCGRDWRQGYLNVDAAQGASSDVICDATRLAFLPSSCADEIMLNAVFEHLFQWQHEPALREWLRLLRPAGRLVIRWLPNFDEIVALYVSRDRGITRSEFDLFEVYRYTHGDPNEDNAYSQIHKSLFTRDSICKLLSSNGFEIVEIRNECYPGEDVAVNLNLIAVKPEHG